MTPSQAGAGAEAAVLAALVAAGRPVLLPFASHHRYDLVFEDERGFQRVQCKVGRLVGGAIRFRTHSTTGGKLTGYFDDVDFFGVHCAETNGVYLIPATGLPQRGAHLRVDIPRNGQREGIRWADAYEVSG